MTRVPSPSLSGLRPMLLPASLLTALLTVPRHPPWARFPRPAAIGGPPAIVQTPGPESLRPRAEEYWRLLVSGDRFGASQFLRPEDRPAFLQGREQAFRDPAIESVELSDDGARATMEIAFDLLTPIGVFSWKIRQEWTAVDGEWMAEPRQTAGNPFATPARSRIRTRILFRT